MPIRHTKRELLWAQWAVEHLLEDAYWGYYSNVSRGKRRRAAAQRLVAAGNPSDVCSAGGIPPQEE